MAWLTGWYRRKPKLVKGSIAGSQTNYQLKLTIYKGSGTDTDNIIYLGGYANNNFSDLRFTSSDETTLLPYWIESYISGISAIVWIKIDSIPADPFSKTIYIYYSNPSATSASNGTNTFIQWHGTASSSYLDSLIVPSNNIIYETIAEPTGNGNVWFGIASTLSDTPTEALTMKLIPTGKPYVGVYYFAWHNGTYSYNYNANDPYTGFHRLTIKRYSNEAHYYIDGVDWNNGPVTSQLPTGNLGLGVFIYSGGFNQNWSFARKYASPEPTWSTTSPEQTYTANLTISSIPIGAEIWINNVDQGTTTTSWFTINPGTYTITLKKAGYDDYIEIITLSSNQNAMVQGNLVLSGAPICSSTLKYEGDTIHLSATPKDGISPYYVEFRKNSIPIISYPNSQENIEITYNYILTNDDIRFASLGIIEFSAYIRDSCPTGPQTCEQTCTTNIGCIAPVCNFIVT